MASMTVTAGQSPAWHTLDSATVLALLGSREAGLAETERIVRRARFGPNQVRTREPKREHRLRARSRGSSIRSPPSK